MDFRDMTGRQPILQVHETGNGEPALDTCQSLQGVSGRARFELAHPEVEDGAEYKIESQERNLKGAPVDLGMILVKAPEQLFLWGRGIDRGAGIRRLVVAVGSNVRRMIHRSDRLQAKATRHKTM